MVPLPSFLDGEISVLTIPHPSPLSQKKGCLFLDRSFDMIFDIVINLDMKIGRFFNQGKQKGKKEAI
jgi:uracil DNA glycosylase